MPCIVAPPRPPRLAAVNAFSEEHQNVASGARVKGETRFLAPIVIFSRLRSIEVRFRCPRRPAMPCIALRNLAPPCAALRRLAPPCSAFECPAPPAVPFSAPRRPAMPFSALQCLLEPCDTLRHPAVPCGALRCFFAPLCVAFVALRRVRVFAAPPGILHSIGRVAVLPLKSCWFTNVCKVS